MADTDPALIRLARRQHGVVSREQLRHLELTRSRVAHQLSSGRWTALGDEVVVLAAAVAGLTLGRRQLMWAAVLTAGPCSVLGSHSALELAGFRSWAGEAAEIHVIVPRGTHVTSIEGVRVHESRRLRPGDRWWRHGLPATRPARSAVDAGAWQPWPRFACALLAAVVQQRLCTGAQLDEALAEVGRVRHKAYMRLATADIAGGAGSLGEIDVAAVCRRFNLQTPLRQVRRRDSSGRWRYTDCEWKCLDGSRLVLEVDGSHHLDPSHWRDDIVRERGLVISGARVLRATAFDVRLDARTLATDLLAAGVPSADLSAAQHALTC